ncbi:PTS ascorbate transporter subunit IIC [Shimazuella alba]|uniref:Ascorbate-specific PTS system EIIC component n=1 Tax=Shimazuella alba TaxID=2690964 RepID=A0A6I4VVZ6_9BACL|nr:PTS ascorbate transporter subunit IIC [Shimazuella alba]MXQ55113.1 PTS ascorbate transporter subunit IIC [Shimazuella alba]
MLEALIDIIGNPSILIGIFAFVGLILQKKSLSEIVSGTLKTIMGFIMIGAGANVIVSSLDIFGKMFNMAFHITGVVTSNEAVVSIAQKTFGIQMALIMVFGMIINIFIARFTKLKYIFLTGHHTLFMACVLSLVLSTSGVKGIPLIAIGSIVVGVWMAISPALLQSTVRKVTGSDQIALGHFGSIGFLIAAFIGKFLGDRKKTTEDISVPKNLSFLSDGSVAVSLTMTILFLVIAFFAGPAMVEKQLSNGTNFLVFSIIQAITFAVGVHIVMAGVKLLISEIVPAFKGIAEKLVPNAKPALDCPTLFPYAPNAVIIGFIMSFLAGVLSMFLFPIFGLAMIVPGLVPHFFCGATAGIFGNATGGRRGAILGSFANGLCISFLPALLIPFLGNLISKTTTFGDADYGVIGILIGYVMMLK